jgi:Protein of unknown function (DUF3761)
MKRLIFLASILLSTQAFAGTQAGDDVRIDQALPEPSSARPPWFTGTPGQPLYQGLGPPGTAMGVPMTPRQLQMGGEVGGYGEFQGGYDAATRTAAIRGLAGPQIAPMSMGDALDRAASSLGVPKSDPRAMAMAGQVLQRDEAVRGQREAARQYDLGEKRIDQLGSQIAKSDNPQERAFLQQRLDAQMARQQSLAQAALPGAVAQQLMNEDRIAQRSATAYATLPYDTCPYGTYQATSGDCVERPDYCYRDLTARCRDGTYSHSESHQGACSHHGGVSEFER